MSEKAITVVYEGKRNDLPVGGKTYLEIEEAIKELHGLRDIAILAKQKGGTECELWDDEDLANLPSTTEIVVYENSMDPLAIKLGSESYSLSEIPASNTALINVAKEVVMNDFNVPEFVTRLEDFVVLVSKADNHLIAASEVDLSSSLKVMGRDTIKPLLNKCKTTLDMYVMSSRDILEKLMAAFEYCRDGDHESASINLKQLNKVATSMQKESEKRAKELETAMKVAKEILDDTSEKYGGEGKTEKVKKDVLDSVYAELTLAKNQIKEGEDAMLSVAQAREDYKQVNQTIGGGRRLAWSIWYAFRRGESDNALYNEWIEKWKAKEEAKTKAKGVDPKVMTTAREEEEKQSEIVTKLKKDYDKTFELLECLNQAVGSMRMACSTMQRMSEFWGIMEMVTNQFAESQSFIECFEKAAKDGDKTKTMRITRSRVFKTQGISYMARVVAIRDISTKCRRAMSTVDEDMDRFLTDTPSRAEAEQRLAEWPVESTRKSVVPKISEDIDELSSETEREIRKCFQLSYSSNKSVEQRSTSVSVEQSGELEECPCTILSVEVSGK